MLADLILIAVVALGAGAVIGSLLYRRPTDRRRDDS